MMKGLLVSLAVVGFCLPEPLLAAQTAPQQPAPGVIDVTLMPGGALMGQVVDPQGIPLAKTPVAVRNQGREVARALTDSRGYFAVRGLRGGVYEVIAAEGHGIYRLWTSKTAPPACQRGVLVVAGRDMVRAQGTVLDGLCCWLSNPFVVAGIVATAVAVPVAVHNSRRPSSP